MGPYEPSEDDLHETLLTRQAYRFNHPRRFYWKSRLPSKKEINHLRFRLQFNICKDITPYGKNL